MGIMAIGQIIVLSALFLETLSAPSGCIEACDFYQTSYQSHVSGGRQDHAGLIDGSAHLNDHDYAKPGNWTEHNQYNTDSGHGQVHEERGQYVGGSKRVRYYKKNFTSSYGNVNELGDLSGQRRYDSLRIPSNQHFESQARSQLGQAVTREIGYNRLHSQQTQSSSTRINSESERLEDFGEYSGHAHVNQHEVPRVDVQTSDRTHHAVETVPGNWSRVDSYKTDGGHGRVFEEEGQYVTGPKKVRYFKKNYTSSYSASGVPQSNVGSTTLDELHSELQRNLHKQLDNFRREFHQASNEGHTSASTTHRGSIQDLTQETVGFHDLQTAESDGYRQQLDYRVPSSGLTHHYADHQERETLVETRQPSYTYPAGNTGYGTQSQTYQTHESHVSRVHPASQSSHSSFPSYTQVPVTRGSGYDQSLHNVHVSEHHVDETQRAQEISGGYRSSLAQNQLAESSRRVYNPSTSHITYPSRRDETRRYEEHWSSSSHTGGGNVAPDFTHGHASGLTTGGSHYDRDAYGQQRGHYRAAQEYDSHAHTSESSYNTGYRTNSGQLVSGSLDLGQAARGADCTEETQQYRQETRYHRKYKRDDRHVQQDQELSRTVDDQRPENLMQQSEQLTQQTDGQLEFGQQTVGDLKDLMQQSEQFTRDSDDFTQQTSGKLEFGHQQTVDDQQHFEDLTQQAEHQLEFGQQIVGDQHLEDLTQQNKQLTQQTEGQLEFGQHTIDNQHSEDLTQQSEQFTQRTQESDDFTEYTNGELEFGQQTASNQHLEDLAQQNEQFTQQTQGSDDITQYTNGKLEFDQQSVSDQHLKDLTQQTQDSDDFTQQTEQFQQHEKKDSNAADFTQQTVGKLEYEQQNDDTWQLGRLTQQPPQQRGKSNDDFTQQTVTQLEFEQQGDQHSKDLKQNEQFTQQTFDDFAPQTNGELELGQQTQSIDKYTKPKSQRLEEFHENDEDLTEQTTVFNDFTQQPRRQLGFEQVQSHGDGKLKVDNQHLDDSTQQNQDLTQQAGYFNDFTQQTTGNLEYGQQREQQQRPSWLRYNTQHSESFSQQNDWNPSQQSYQYPFQNKQFAWQSGEMSQKTEFDQDFAPQTDQQSKSGVIKPAPKPKPRQRLQKHDSVPSPTDATDFDLFKPIEVSSDSDTDDFHERNIQDNSRLTDPNYRRSRIIYAQGGSVFDNEKENMDRLHWVHKSNDATVGLQWHYTYHPSDLTNIEGSHDNYYPQHNVNSKPEQTDDMQQQSKSFDQQETQDNNAFQYARENSHTFQPPISQAQHNKYDQQSGPLQQSGLSYFDDQFNQDSKETPSRVIPLRHNENLQRTTDFEKESVQTTEQTDQNKMESRILEAYGGGPYDASRSDDIYRRVRLNPSATLPPIYIGGDPWDIREKPRERIIPWTVINTLPTTNTPKEETTTEVMKTTVQVAETTTEAASHSFWNRLGHKITNTYDKAKEKAKEIFG